MSRPPLLLRLFLIAPVIAGIVAAATLDWRDASWVSTGLVQFGLLVPLAFVLAHVASSLCFVPRSFMAMAAGTLWEFWPASLLSLAGAVAGATAGFLLARYINGGWLVPEEMKRVGPLLQRAEAGGWRSVALVRLIPFPHALTNYALGVTRLRLVDYVLGSAFGLLPQTFVFVNLGISGRLVLDGGAWLEPMLWGLGILALSILLPRLLRRAP